jgi:hypothetical protein
VGEFPVAVEVTGMRYKLEVRITPADVGKRVVIRWRPPELDGSKLLTDVLGILEEADDQFFKVRRGRDGQLIVIPRERALAGKVVPPAPPPRRPAKPPNLPDTRPEESGRLPSVGGHHAQASGQGRSRIGDPSSGYLL